MAVEKADRNRMLDMDTTTKKFGEILTGDRCFKEHVHLEINDHETVPPVKRLLRHVPVAIKSHLKQELKLLEGLHVIFCK